MSENPAWDEVLRLERECQNLRMQYLEKRLAFERAKKEYQQRGQ